MMNLRTALLGYALVVPATAALGADLPRKAFVPEPPPFAAVQPWTGWELAVGAAGRWDTIDLTGLEVRGATSVKPSSVVIEGLSLLNYEFANHVVVGHKLKFGYSNPTIAGHDAATWQGLTGPLVGYDFGPLLYVSGGLAAQTQNLNALLGGTTNPTFGWYIGPGIEFRPFGNNVVMGVDVNYVDMNGINVPGVLKLTNTAFNFGGHIGLLFQ